MAGLWCAAAAAMPPTELQPSAVSRCLLPPEDERGTPEYPFALYKRDVAGRVKASVTFPGGLFGPEVKILDEQGSDGFAGSVRSYLGKLSAPCVPQGRQATLEFDFVFQPRHELVLVGGPVDPEDAEREKLMTCLMHTDKRPAPDYPAMAERQQLQGRVYALLTFADGRTPPQVQLRHRPSARDLAESVREWAAGLRLPCMAGEPVTLGLIPEFRIEGDSYGFKPMRLVQFMGLVKDIRRQRIAWDTNEMGCPFELRLTYLQPLAPNQVRQAGTQDLRRKPLLDWLAAAELSAERRMLDALFADTADIAVPCAKFNLNPKE